MTNNEAHQILDRVKNGIFEPNKRVTEALLTLGDLQPNRESHSETCFVSPYHRTRALANEGAYERQFGPLWKHSNGCKSED